MMVPVPPIYDAAASLPGLLLDECFTSADAPSGTAEALLVAAEAALTTAGASSLIASYPAAGPLRPLYERHGYEPVTLYLAKHGLRADALPPRVRPASAADVPGIVKLSAEHRKTLAAVNPRFWHIHPEADSRFDAWMRRSLTFGDRDMLVAGAPGEVRGYVVAQPCSPLLVPIAHDVAGIGVVDDFYDADFAPMGVNEEAKTNYYRMLLGGFEKLDVLSISPARHFVMFDQPEKFAAALDGALAKVVELSAAQ